ncbi:MAG: 3'(2'),5'-bisphosphate nucleotidase CysQ [Eubacteriales bacterium]
MPLAVLAGEEIMRIYAQSDLGISYKDDSSPLTAADKASNEIIVEGLSRLYPQFAQLTEESADDRSRLCERWCFIVDPLDGTKEFIKRNGEFTVNIALSHDHESVAGVIYVPATREVYYAARGMGAFRTRGGVTERIHVTERTEDIVVMESRSHNTPALEALLASHAGKISKRIGAGSSLKGCRVAEGVADIYYRCGPTMEWDTAAMQIICEEAGAIFRQYDGYDSPMYYNRTHTRNDLGFYILNRPENKL